MKNTIKKIWLLLTLALSIVSLQAQQPKRPNIILFLVDDMGWEDTSVPFSGSQTANNRKYHTPFMEQLAKEGMLFTNAYSNTVCTPTRVSLMTGWNAAHHHVTNWTHPEKDHTADAPDDQFLPTEWNLNGLSPVAGIANTFYNDKPLPQRLKEAGYFTIHVGKAHWGSQGTPGASPYNIGFTVNIAGHAAGHPQSYLSEDNYGNLPGKNSAQSVPDLEQYWQSGTFLTEALTREALQALDLPVKQHQPFFLNLAHYAVHVPLMADKRYYQQYLDRGLDSTEAKYASLLEGMDASLGEVMNYLKEKRLTDNTLLIFLSDNGGLSIAPPRGGASHTQNLPLKAGKGSLYEGGIRVPMIVRYPQVVKPGTTSSVPVMAEDFLPTVLDAAGIKRNADITALDGRSYLPALTGKKQSDNTRELVWHYPNKWRGEDGPAINYYSAIRKGDWKLVYSLRTSKAELYNLRNDLGEEHDLATELPEKVTELKVLLGNTLKKFDAPMPVVRATGQKVPYPGR